MSEYPLVQDYVAREMAWHELMPFLRQHRDAVFGDTWSADTASLLSEEERAAQEKLGALMASAYRLTVGIFRGDTLVGWSFGVQQSREHYYMINSGILPEHQAKDLHGASPGDSVASRARGFQVITSRHVVTNNRVIIPKLRAGFVITGCEVTDHFGTLVLLAYFTNPKRRALYDVRAGQARPEGEVRRSLGLE
ncbi:MAG: hypothetical protein U0527_06065 [Candidatus Eisenbacteria bacterium]